MSRWQPSAPRRVSSSSPLLGLFVGLGAAFLGARVMEALLFGVQARNPIIFGATAFLLTLVTLAAATLPAHRASRVDPVIALRSE